MWYGLYETILNVKNLIVTKVFYPKARLVRFPSYIRNKKHIIFGEGFTCGYRCRLESVQTAPDKYGKIVFGKNVKIGDSVHIACASNVTIGDDVLMASHIFITDLDHGRYVGEHQTSPEVAPDDREICTADVKIGNRVWIGENVVVLKGVTIGDGCVIGSASVVTKSIPNGCIVVGSPAKVIKKYDEERQEWLSV
ncbi:MAG: acetyltransferase [Lachnospiraceae bacterium]|nr:acetyltransferase [Lachnospiraceae bacterium]